MSWFEINENNLVGVCSTAGHSCVFVKDMAYYLVNHLDTPDLLPEGYIHTFLIRDPKKSVYSLYKMSLNKELTGQHSACAHGARGVMESVVNTNLNIQLIDLYSIKNSKTLSRSPCLSKSTSWKFSKCARNRSSLIQRHTRFS